MNIAGMILTGKTLAGPCAACSDPTIGRVFLAADKNSARGFLALAFGYSLDYHGRDAFVDEFLILEKYRGKGLGGKMLAHAEKAAKRLSQGHPSRSHGA